MYYCDYFISNLKKEIFGINDLDYYGKYFRILIIFYAKHSGMYRCFFLKLMFVISPSFC